MDVETTLRVVSLFAGFLVLVWWDQVEAGLPTRWPLTWGPKKCLTKRDFLCVRGGFLVHEHAWRPVAGENLAMGRSSQGIHVYHVFIWGDGVC